MYSARRARVRAVIITDGYGEQSATAGEIIDGDGAIDSGLLDADGNILYRLRDPIRLGFERNRRG